MEGYLLDTSALSAYLNGNHPHHATAAAVIDGLPSNALKLVSIVSLAELDYGVRLAELAGSTHLVEYRQRLLSIRQYAPLPMTTHTADAYAELKARLAAHILRRAGSRLTRWIEDWVDMGSAQRLQIDENDLWICAQAKERDLVVVTGDADIRQLASVEPDLKILLTRP